MHPSTLLAVVFPLLAAASKLKHGPEIWGSKNEIDDCEMHQAIYCLHENVCSKGPLPANSKARCTIGRAVAYICNYRTKFDDKGVRRDCDVADLYDAWRHIRVAQNSSTGWKFDGEYTAGFDRRCKDNECDNGWKKGSEGDHCTNLRRKTDWLIDYEGAFYPNYSTKFEVPLPRLGDKTDPIYFTPWRQGKRPG